jgi:hypothetical protein
MFITYIKWDKSFFNEGYVHLGYEHGVGKCIYIWTGKDKRKIAIAVKGWV